MLKTSFDCFDCPSNSFARPLHMGNQENNFEDQEETATQFALQDKGIAIPPSFNNEGFMDDFKKIHFAKGTTTLGFIFKHGIIIAVDSRASMGNYISSQSVKKVIEINPYLLGTMAGGAADCQFWERYLGMQCKLFELRNKRRISVAAASNILANIVYSYKDYGLSMGTMIAGWDVNESVDDNNNNKSTGTPSLYMVLDDGTRLKGQRFSVGSGSLYAYGVLDSSYHYDLEVDEAIELGRRAIFHATHRDAYSGGIINIYHIRRQGWEKVFSADMDTLVERYMGDKLFKKEFKY